MTLICVTLSLSALFDSLTLYQVDTILDQSKLKAFADDKLKVIQKAKFVLDKIENIVGKEENAGYLHFLHFPQCLQKTLTSRSLKSRLSGREF